MTRFFIENYKFTLVLSAFVVIYGLGGFKLLKPESFPDVNLGQVIITTHYDGASAADIETKITKPIEDEIRSVRGLKKVTSVSQDSMSIIMTQVDIDRYNADEVIENLQRAVDRVNGLPQDLPDRPHFLEIKTDEFPVIELAITGPNGNLQRDHIADLLEEELQDNKKISGIDMLGYQNRQYNIQIDPKKLDLYHVGINEVVDKIQSRNLTIPGGGLEKGSSQSLLKIEGKVDSIEALENILIRSNFTGQKVLLKDIATLVDGFEDSPLLTSYNGEPANVLSIKKKAGENLIELAEEVQAQIDIFSKKYPEHAFRIYNNEGKRVERRIQVLSSNGIIGLVLVVFFLLVFLPGRIGIMAAMSLPLAILATFGVMFSAGLTLNTITILALIIAIGMLVDNSVVIAENFSRHRDLGRAPLEAAIQAIQELWAPVTATALTTIAAFLPMLVTSGTIGQFIKGIPIVVTLALVISLLESFFLLPMRLAAGRKSDIQHTVKKDWFARLVVPVFDRMMSRMVRHRYLVLLAFGGIIFGSIYLMAVANKLELFPAEQTEIYLARVDMPSGTRIESTLETLENLSVKVKEKLGDDVLHVVAKAGDSQDNPSDPRGRRGNTVGLVFIFMSEEAKNNRKTNDILEKLRSIKIPETDKISFLAMINGPPMGAPVSVTFRGNNAEQLKAVSEKIRQSLEKVDGVLDIAIDDIRGDDEIAVKIDYEKTARVGLDLRTLGNTLRTAMSGRDVSDINLDNKEVDLFVRFSDDSRQEIAHLKAVKVMDRTGNLIPIGELVHFEKRPGLAQIKRFDYKRAKTVTASINDDIITAAAANNHVRIAFDKISKQYPDVSIKFGGEGENINESMASLKIALILSLVGIFSLLVLIFNSFLKPLIIITTIPLGLVGFAVAFYVQGRPISFLAMIGIVGLGGIIVNSGIVLISFIERMKQESDLPIYDILVQSAGMRLRAVVVTSLTTVSGLLPTAYGIGGSDEFIIPMAMSLAWGLTSGTILALLWVPCAYLIVEDFSGLVKRLLNTVTAKAQTSVATPEEVS